MVEFVHNKEESIGADDSIIFKNNTKDTFNVGVGIIFHKSGLYRVVVDNKCTSVTEESERKIEPRDEIERVCQAIASVMPCRLCPSQCKAKENSSMANCVRRWKLIINRVVVNPYEAISELEDE